MDKTVNHIKDEDLEQFNYGIINIYHDLLEREERKILNKPFKTRSKSHKRSNRVNINLQEGKI